MTFEATTVSGKEVQFGTPIQMELCESFDTPASSLFAVFCILSPVEEIENIVVKNGAEIVFQGMVDEQRTICNESGITIKISARSHSQVIDNEALPITYSRPSLEDIYINHLKPFGIVGVLGAGICQGDFAISKGTCHWSVVEEFCKCVLNVSPKITNQGYLDARQSGCDEEPVVFSNTLGADCRFFSAQIKHKRYGVVGQMYYKSDSAKGYEGVQINEDARKRKITTQRYLNLSGSQKWERQYRLQRELEKTLKGSNEIELSVPFDCFLQIGAPASFLDERLGSFTNYRIFQIEHTISNAAKRCDLTLRPAEHF